MKKMLKHEGFCSLGGQSENDLRSRSLSLALRASLTFSALMQSTCGKTMQTSLLLISCFRNAFITHSFANDPYTFFKPLNASRLALFRKLENVYQGKTQCWAICFISKDSLTIIAIKPELVSRFSLTIFSATIDQCTVKSSNFVAIKNF